MSFIKYRVRNVEPFKDGNIMEGRFLKPGEVLIVTENEKDRIIQSGGILEVLESLVPNPKQYEVVIHEDEVAKILEPIKPEQTPLLTKLGSLETEKPVEEAPKKVSGKNVRKTKS